MYRFKWNPRIKQTKLRLLYRFAGMGIYDEKYILNIGWGLFLRCRDILTVINAVKKGEVLCPKCKDNIIYRSKYRYYQAKLKTYQREEKIQCTNCHHTYSWRELKEKLRRNNPRCLKCGKDLIWDFLKNKIYCPECDHSWNWQKYRKSLKHRKWLPCPYCGTKNKKPENFNSVSDITVDYICPECKGKAYHQKNKFICSNCGYKVNWRTFQLNEVLSCDKCGYQFTWRSWRKNYINKNLLVGNETIFQSYYTNFPKAKTLKVRVLEIDRLIHAVHARGSLGEALIEGTKTSVQKLLNELAYR